MSVAHTGHLVAVALASVPVGVDVELDDADVDGVPAALTDREIAVIAALPDAHRTDALRRVWVRKEAVLKALGFGLARDPRTIELSDPGAPPAVLAPAGPAGSAGMTLRDLEGAPGAVAALALAGVQPVEVREEDGDALLDVTSA